MDAISESEFFSVPSSNSVQNEDGITGIHLISESESGRFRVYGARHFNRRVVLKCHGENYINDPVILAQLHKEFSIGFAIDSPYVCRSLALVNILDGVCALEMEYCNGVTLRKMFDSPELAPDKRQAYRIVDGILEGLLAIHQRGVVHRDIKPSNIIIDPLTSLIRIIDFGCADAPDHLLLKEPAGTLRYHKTTNNDSAPSPADDLYALGLTLSELSQCVTGKEMSTRIREFSIQLINGQIQSTAEALQWWHRHNSKRSERLILTTSIITLITIAGGWIYSSLTHKDNDNNDKIEEDTLISATIQPDTTNLQNIATKAGQLLSRYNAGDITGSDAADAVSISLADSIYVNNLIYNLSGKRFSNDEITSLTTDIFNTYSPLLKNELEKKGLNQYYSRRLELLFYYRIQLNLQAYNS